VSQSNALAEDDTLDQPVRIGLPFAPIAYGETDTGLVRKQNEDSFAVVPHLGLFMVADGIGGAAAGEIASRTAIEQVQWAVEDGETTWPAEGMPSGPESGPRRFIAGIHRANRAIRAMARRDPLKKGMGTTFAGVLVLERCAVIAHVGDSRVYRLRDGELEQMTHDHSLANQLVAMGFLEAGEVASFPRRNVITRAVGTHETVEVDMRIVDVREGDAFLLCSDGLHGELDDDEIVAVLREHANPVAAVARLIDCANDKGSADNVTVVLVRLDTTSA
jgi:serine/threonine protein phosphatase PrpC